MVLKKRKYCITSERHRYVFEWQADVAESESSTKTNGWYCGNTRGFISRWAISTEAICLSLSMFFQFLHSLSLWDRGRWSRELGQADRTALVSHPFRYRKPTVQNSTLKPPPEKHRLRSARSGTARTATIYRPSRTTWWRRSQGRSVSVTSVRRPWCASRGARRSGRLGRPCCSCGGASGSSTATAGCALTWTRLSTRSSKARLVAPPWPW